MASKHVACQFPVFLYFFLRVIGKEHEKVFQKEHEVVCRLTLRF